MSETTFILIACRWYFFEVLSFTAYNIFVHPVFKHWQYGSKTATCTNQKTVNIISGTRVLRDDMPDG